MADILKIQVYQEMVEVVLLLLNLLFKILKIKIQFNILCSQIRVNT